MHYSGDDVIARLPPMLRTLCAEIVTLATRHHATVWLVGGVVRDLLLGIPIERDLDLAVEGDAVALADALAAATGGRVTARHQAFGTASVVLSRGDIEEARHTLTLDLAMTRVETYPAPAALPIVQAAPIYADLARRDFSINALAVALHAHNGHLVPGQMLDPFHGQDDLQAGLLRVLHERSFRDDPTRALRGLRLSARMNLLFEPHTRALLDAALADTILEQTTPDRVRTELCLALEEPAPDQVLHRAHQLGILPHIFAPLQRITPDRARTAALAGSPLVRAGILTYDLSSAEREALIAAYRLPNEAARLLRDVGQVQSVLAELRQPGRQNSDIDRLLRPFHTLALDVVRYIHAATEIEHHVTRYQTELRHIVPLLNGHALQQLGIAPGPRIGRLLHQLRAARLDGLVTTRADEEHWIRQHMRHDI